MGSEMCIRDRTSPSRVAFKLEAGDLVVDVKKLNRESSFVVESPVGTSGVRGTQFGLSVKAGLTQLAVLEGKVGFLDANQKAKSVETSQKLVGSQDGASEVNALSESEQVELLAAVTQSQDSVLEFDLTRLANTVDGYAPKPNYIVKSALNMELIWCPPGSYRRGDGDKPHNVLKRNVILSKGFYLGKYEVTQEQYQKVLGDNPSKIKGKNRPVDLITWNDAVSFCEILNQKKNAPRGMIFTLPTEAEWEYACRAGSVTKFAWGDEINNQQANYNWDGDWDDGKDYQHARDVGQYPPNSWGFHDMHGNVREWTFDWYRESYPIGILIDPTGPSNGIKRSVRSGSYITWNDGVSSGWRTARYQNESTSELGFRLCLAPAR